MAIWVAQPRYSPGHVTAALVSAPHSVWTLLRLVQDGRLDRRFLTRTVGATVSASVLVTAAAVFFRLVSRKVLDPSLTG